MESEYEFLSDPEVIQEAAWVTARKEKGSKFTGNVFFQYLISEHSPIRRLVLSWRIRDLERRASSHMVRHKHAEAFIGGSRPDWFEKDDGTNDHLQDFNCQALIDFSRKRLCSRAWKETRRAAEGLKESLMGSGDEFYEALGKAMVPNCVYRNGCPEGKKCCGYFEKLVEGVPEDELFSFFDINERYGVYNRDFFGR